MTLEYETALSKDYDFSTRQKPISQSDLILPIFGWKVITTKSVKSADFFFQKKEYFAQHQFKTKLFKILCASKPTKMVFWTNIVYMGSRRTHRVRVTYCSEQCLTHSAFFACHTAPRVSINLGQQYWGIAQAVWVSWNSPRVYKL